MASVDEVANLADVELFLSYIDEKTVHKMCHQASTWLAVEIKKNGLSDYNIHICAGTFNGLDHSWILVENLDDLENWVVDITLSQFIDCETPFVGILTSEYEIEESVCLCDDIEVIKPFIERLGV